MGLLLLSNAVFGFFILALSGAIVFNVLTALLAGQTRQIGVMKALGGSRFQIARVYLLEAGLLGVAAIALALPIGLAGSRWICDWMAVFLNFDIANYMVPFWVYALVVAVGIAVPIVAALIPVWFGTRVTVRESLAPNSLMERTYGTSIVDRALARVGGSTRVVLLAIRNASRNRLRVTLTIVTLAAAGVFLMSALNVRQSMISMLDRLFEAQRADLSVTLASNYPIDVIERIARGTAGHVRRRRVDRRRRGPSHEPNADANGPIATRKRFQRHWTATGIAPDRRSTFTNGTGLDGDPHGVVVNTELFERLDAPAIGDELQIRVAGTDASLRLAGVSREPFSPPAAYVARAFFDDRPEAGTANSLRVALANSDARIGRRRAGRTSTSRLEREGIRVLQTNTKADRRFSYDEHMVMIYVFLHRRVVHPRRYRGARPRHDSQFERHRASPRTRRAARDRSDAGSRCADRGTRRHARRRSGMAGSDS